MIFEKGHLYHIYNQGNNRQRIFFRRENYLYFMEKIKKHILPYADILAWCLMPNHFHLMVHVNAVELPLGTKATPQGLTTSQTLSSSLTLRSTPFNYSIGVMLRSYTRAINIQENRTGALFRQQTKAICLTQNDKITRSWFTSQGITQINVSIPEKQYPNNCFNYINFNPVKDGLVKRNEEWEFTSYSDMIGLRSSSLINRTRIEELGLVLL